MHLVVVQSKGVPSLHNGHYPCQDHHRQILDMKVIFCVLTKLCPAQIKRYSASKKLCLAEKRVFPIGQETFWMMRLRYNIAQPSIGQGRFQAIF